MDVRELVKRTKEQAAINAKKAKEMDKLMDKLLAEQIPAERFEKKDERDVGDWDFQHDDLSCPECKEEGYEFFIGIHKKQDAHKYECTSCGHTEIKTIKQLYKEAGL